ncbi:MAG: SDR family NAD(P)-dependent oxidoreductase [Bacteroidales bacterium]
MNRKYAIVTGAANGLGKAFALELSKCHFNTILIDLPNSGLSELCEHLKNTYSTDSTCFMYDLTLKENIIELAEIINSNYNVNILINNVGVGGTEHFDKTDVETINKIIQLNVMATSVMTHQLIPNLKKQDKSYILNVSSMAAFSPIGYKTVYPASKAFVHSFSRGLYQEFKNSNIFVSVVNPGPMKTNEDVTRRIISQGFFGRLGLLSPEKVTEISIRQLFKRDTLIMLNFANGINWLLLKTVPIFLRLPLLTNTVKREIDNNNTIFKTS